MISSILRASHHCHYFVIHFEFRQQPTLTTIASVFTMQKKRKLNTIITASISQFTSQTNIVIIYLPVHNNYLQN